ncbi:hypothetical protein [Streptomyces melanogenes]|uniref:hypothetical protein n=1 Tax=Streptomyces melanogenes TaxID=67326 RepID=UPI00378D960F
MFIKRTSPCHGAPGTAAPHPNSAQPARTSWPRLLSAGLLTGMARHVGSLLAAWAISWWYD